MVRAAVRRGVEVLHIYGLQKWESVPSATLREAVYLAANTCARCM